MKNYVLIGCFTLVATLAHAQTDKGQGIWTGSVEFSYNRDDYENNSDGDNSQSINTRLSFSRGVFFKDNWLAGASLSGGWSRFRRNSEDVSQSDVGTRLGVSAELSGFVRRYWGKDRWRVFLGGGIGLGNYLVRHEGQSAIVTKESEFQVVPFTQVGANYYLNDRIGLEASATSNSFPVSFGTINVGLIVVTGNQFGNRSDSGPVPQTDKGRWILGGNLEFRTVGYSQNRPVAFEGRSNSCLISPSMGWFIRKNTLVGVSLPIYFVWSKTLTGFSYGISPYLKKYVSNYRLRPFFEGRIGYEKVTYKTNAARKTAQNAINLAVSGGLAYFLGERFIIEARLGELYLMRHFNMTNAVGDFNSWTSGLSATLKPGFTVQYVFD